MDLAKGYWQIGINPEDRYKTSFLFNNTTYCFKRLPFGLKNAGDSFCRLISSALKEVKNNDNFKAYVDDIFIHSREFQTYSDTLRQILNVCRKFDLKLNGKNVTF